VGAIVIGVGNPYRRDDGVGPAVVKRLRQHSLPGVTFAECDGEPTRLLDLWSGADLAVVVDAVRTASPRPGAVHRRSLLHPSVGATRASSSHVMELGDSVALAAALDRLPGALLLFAVEAADTSLGVGLTPAVEAAASVLVEEIAQLLEERPAPGTRESTGGRDQ
jgi:hydrogenase maturation protease